jgi:hypothetical protein
MQLAKVYRELPTFSPYRQNIRDNIDEVLKNTTSENLDDAYVDIIRYAEQQVQKYHAEGGKSKKRKSVSNSKKSDSKQSPKKRKKLSDSPNSDSDSDDGPPMIDVPDREVEPSEPQDNEAHHIVETMLEFKMERQSPRKSHVEIPPHIPPEEPLNYPRISVVTSIPPPPILQEHIQSMYTNKVQSIHVRWILQANRTEIVSDAESEYLQMLVYNNQCPLSTVTLFLSLYECLMIENIDQAKTSWMIEGSVLLAEILDMLARKNNNQLTEDTSTSSAPEMNAFLSVESMAAPNEMKEQFAAQQSE